MGRKLLTVIILLASMKFFDARFANTEAGKNICYGLMLIAIVMSIPFCIKYKTKFSNAILMITIGIVISIFMANYSWDQPLNYGVTTLPYIVWPVYFLLLRWKINQGYMENLIAVLGGVYFILFFFQLTHTDVVYFGQHEEFREDRGILRVAFPGGGLLFLSSLLAINRVTTSERYGHWWLAYALIGFLVVVLQVTRQQIVFLAFVYFLHLLKDLNLSKKILTILLSLLIVFAFFNSDSSISRGLVSQQKEDASAGMDYIRIVSAEFYLTQFTPNTISAILGNGMYNANSSYGKYMTSLGEEKGYFLSDVGILEVYILFGFITFAGYIILFYKSLISSLPKEKAYLKYYMLMIALTSLTSDALMSYSYIFPTILVLYLYQTDKRSEFNSILKPTRA